MARRGTQLRSRRGGDSDYPSSAEDSPQAYNAMGIHDRETLDFCAAYEQDTILLFSIQKSERGFSFGGNSPCSRN